MCRSAVLERAGLEPELILGADMTGGNTSGGIGGVSTGSSADIGELGFGADAAAVAGTGDDIAALGCGVGVADGDDAAGVVAATGVGAVQPGLVDELHEIPVKLTKESPALHCVRPIRL